MVGMCVYGNRSKITLYSLVQHLYSKLFVGSYSFKIRKDMVQIAYIGTSSRDDNDETYFYLKQISTINRLTEFNKKIFQQERGKLCFGG